MELKLEALSKRKAAVLGMDQSRQSAVGIPLIRTEAGYDVLFEVRSAHIPHQPGDVCFPGGMMEEGETPYQAAVREMAEELLIRKEQIRLLGPMDILFQPGLTIYPFFVLLEDYQGSFSAAECQTVFRVPLQFFFETEAEEYGVTMKQFPDEDFPYDRIVGGKAYRWRERKGQVYFYEYDGITIWGLTAQIMRAAAEILKSLN